MTPTDARPDGPWTDPQTHDDTDPVNAESADEEPAHASTARESDEAEQGGDGS